MKQFYLLAIATFSLATSFAQSKINLSSPAGSWTNASDWDKNRLPTNGDTIVIPANTAVTVSTNVTASDIHLRVYGTVTISNKTTQLTLNGNSDIVVYEGGKIVGNEASQKLRIGGAVAYQGNNAAITGPATATAALPSFGVYILPVKFTGFSLARQNSDVLVQWSTAEELNNSAFEVERSSDGSNWKKIATVTGKGTSTTASHYSYTDKGVTAPLTFYRIRQVDMDGQFTYTAVKTIKSGTTALEVNVAAINNHVVLQFSQQVKSTVEVRLVSLSGQVVGRQVIRQPIGQVILNTGALKGNYIVALSDAQDLSIARKVVF